MTQLRLRTENLHEVSLGQRRVLFHVPTTSLFDLDGLSCQVLDFLRDDGPALDSRAVVEHFQGRHAAADVLEALGELEALDLIAAPGLAKPRAARPAIPKDSLSALVLNVSTGCNLACSYCYKEDLTSPAAARRLSPAKAEAAVDLLLRESGRQQRVSITFFGGEPLTNLSLIRHVVAYAERRGAETAKTFDFSMTTNGTLLDDTVIDYLDSHRFGLSISMDGPREVHDRNRRTIGGRGTYAVVAPKVRRLLERYRSRPVGARVTVTAGAVDVLAIHGHLKDELGFAEVGLAPVTAGLPSALCLGDDEIKTVFDGMKTLAWRYRDAALTGRDIGFSNISQMMTTLHEGNTKLVPCGAGLSMLAVDAEGELKLCHRFTGSPLDGFGDVATGIDRARVEAFIDRAVARADGSCASCRARHVCAGGCYHEAYARHGDPFHPTDHYCELIRDWIDTGIAIYADIMAQNPGFLGQRRPPRRNIA